MGLNPSVLVRWRREAKKYGENSFPGKENPKLSDEQREIAELSKRGYRALRPRVARMMRANGLLAKRKSGATTNANMITR